MYIGFIAYLFHPAYPVIDSAHLVELVHRASPVPARARAPPLASPLRPRLTTAPPLRVLVPLARPQSSPSGSRRRSSSRPRSRSRSTRSTACATCSGTSDTVRPSLVYLPTPAPVCLAAASQACARGLPDDCLLTLPTRAFPLPSASPYRQGGHRHRLGHRRPLGPLGRRPGVLPLSVAWEVAS